jgi:hypothetical protein
MLEHCTRISSPSMEFGPADFGKPDFGLSQTVISISPEFGLRMIRFATTLM